MRRRFLAALGRRPVDDGEAARTALPDRPNTENRDAVYICLCNALADMRIKEAVADGADRPRDVYAACGCRAQCGNCAKAILSVIRDAKAMASGRRQAEA